MIALNFYIKYRIFDTFCNSLFKKQFQLISPIFRGFSTIYLAKQSTSSDQFAIKKIYAHSQLEVSRIRREIYAHQAFGDHEHLMKILGVYRERYGESGASVFFLVMDFCQVCFMNAEIVFKVEKIRFKFKKVLDGKRSFWIRKEFVTEF